MSKTGAAHFLPGQSLTIRPEWRRRAQPRYGRACVHAPGRVHMSVFDFSKMAPGLGGGGLGISVDTAYSQVLISAGTGDASSLNATGRHLLELFKQCVGYHRDDLSVNVARRIQYAHAGFGSNVTFNTGLLAGLNALFGSPFSVHEIWTMLTQNYVENAEDGEHIYYGLDTGVGEACVLYGGLVWIDEGVGVGDGRYLGSVLAQDLWVVTAVGKVERLAGEAMRALGEAAAKGLGGKSEAEVVAGLCQEYQKRYGAALQECVHARMRPAFLRNDLAGLLESGWELNDVGNMKVLEGIYEPHVLRDLTSAMRRAGSLFAGMSSAGPGFFAFSDSERGVQQLRDVLQARFSEYFSDFAVGRAGAKLDLELEAPLPSREPADRAATAFEQGQVAA